MSPSPESFIAHLRANGYHPRSNAHSNALAESIAADLVEHCPSIRDAAAAGRLVYDLNFTLLSGTAEWNVDLVLGEPSMGVREPLDRGRLIRKSRPSTVQVAIEIKSVMTEHHKAVKNRKRDLEAHHDHVHRYSRRAIAGGVLVINGSATFLSPLRRERTTHRNPSDLVAHCLEQLRAVTVRGSMEESGLDAKAAVVVDMDNEDFPRSRYVTARPAPPVGDPMHYDAFIQAICSQYTERFANR
jgi:hypothetical protein